jgi:hypothetical protein
MPKWGSVPEFAVPEFAPQPWDVPRSGVGSAFQVVRFASKNASVRFQARSAAAAL